MFRPSWRISLSAGLASICWMSPGLGNAITWHSPARSLVSRTSGFGVIENTSESSGWRPPQYSGNAR